MKRNPWLFSMGNFTAALMGMAFSSFVIFFYVDYLKLPAMLIGTGMAIYGIWNAINDPLLGYLSDRTTSARGRRTPYILYGMLPLALVFFLIWLPKVGWFGGNVTALFVYFMIVIFFYDALYTMVILNWTALFPEMYQEAEERNRVSAIRQILGIVGNILGIAIPPLLYASIGWPAMGLGFALLCLGSMALGLKSFEENPAFREAGTLNFKDAILFTLKNKAFLAFVIGNLFTQFTFVMLQGAINFYTKYVLKISTIETSLMLATIFIVAACFVYPWSKLANRRGAKYAMLLACILYAVALIPFWFAGSFASGMVVAVLIGVGLGGVLVFLDVLLSDAIDEDELRTGVRREGMYFGVNALVMRLSVSLQALITGYVLSTSGYDANLAAQPDSAILGIKLLITVIPMVAMILAIVFYKLYPLHGDRLFALKQAIAEKRKPTFGA